MKRNEFKSALKITIDEYLETKTVNGAWLLKDSDNTRSFKIFWLVLLICLAFVAAYLAFALWVNFYSYPVTHSNGRNMPSLSVPFPGVSICKPIFFQEAKARDFIRTL